MVVDTLRTISVLLTLALASGCNTLSSALPKCDGYAKRPLNRSMWQWQDGMRGGTGPLGYSFEDRGHPAFEHYDERSSHRKCAGLRQ
ncbi:hypothetical protein BLJAPNOD_06887 [Ensifer sp. M14]|jgi:type IV secretion system protein VirB7|nr:hypothetical protein B0E45_04485 [Sinorhizobium sp. A49]RDL46693.1 hypothetical protein BLJAPNOD_06887 [Ensifer sp. M14]